jgi:predicted ribosomally synthesized peptide with SipW-like signal peptide
MKKKILVIALSIALVATLSMGSLAWFTDSDSIKNDFHVGDTNTDPDKVFGLDVWETVDNKEIGRGDKTGAGTVYEAILPGQVLSKAPVLENTGIHPMYVRAFVTVSGADILVDAMGGFDWTQTDLFLAGLNTTEWKMDDVLYTADNTLVYVFTYNTALAAKTVSAPLFDSVVIPTGLTKEQAADLDMFSVSVYGQAIQSEHILCNDADSAFAKYWDAEGTFFGYEKKDAAALVLGGTPAIEATPDTIDDVLANAQAGDTIHLATGAYDEIVLTQNDLTVVSVREATVDYLTTNAKDNCIIFGLEFDAAGAKAVGKFATNVQIGDSSANGTDGVILAGCAFTGEAANLDKYAAVYSNEQKYKNCDVVTTVVNWCEFDTSAIYYVHISNPSVGEYEITNNTFGNISTIVGSSIYSTNLKADMLIDNNTFFGGRVFINGNVTYDAAVTYTNNDYINTSGKEYAAVAVKNFDLVTSGNTTNYGAGTFGEVTVDGITKLCYVYDICAIVEDSAALKDALTNTTAESIIVNLSGDMTYDVAAWTTDAMGGTATKTIVINGNGNTLTFNQTNSDWNNVVTNGAKLIINDAKITNAGRNDGPWNRHDINFACDVELNNVTSDKALAFKAGATLNNVTISDANTSDTYAIWIQPNGQTIDINGLTVDMLACTDGRGIKIDNQYVAAADEAVVTLNIKDATFKTEEKSAILVKTTVGAIINLDNVDIAEVAADSTNAVWVDGDAAASADKVVVNGATVIVEP